MVSFPQCGEWFFTACVIFLFLISAIAVHSKVNQLIEKVLAECQQSHT
jgi:hypothetical protein